MSKKDGGQAFPESYIGADAPHEGIGGGMTLRDYFAGQALASVDVFAYDDDWEGEHFADAVRRAYKLADAMLAERDKQ